MLRYGEDRKMEELAKMLAAALERHGKCAIKGYMWVTSKKGEDERKEWQRELTIRAAARATYIQNRLKEERGKSYEI